MRLKDVFKKQKNTFDAVQTMAYVPDGLFTRCQYCQEMILTEDFEKNQHICPKCGHLYALNAYERIAQITDEGSFTEWDTQLEQKDYCECAGYLDKLSDLQKQTGLDEAVITGSAMIDGRQVVLGICDTRFLMGSMGSVFGEKLTRAIEKATTENLPLIIFTCSGGARMQEGIRSLMQMAKISAALKKHSDAGNLYITVLTHPTTGGVTASFAMLGDIILAEPQALIGFAGPRVIRQTIRQELPEGFQRSEFLLEHGFIDAIVQRWDMKQTLSRLLKMHQTPKANIGTDLNTGMKESLKNKEKAVAFVKRYLKYLDEIYAKKIDIAQEDAEIEAWQTTRENSENERTAWEEVELARSSRPSTRDYISYLTKNFFACSGDRLFGDDGAIIGGIAMFGGTPVTVIGHQKGANTTENITRNFGMANPEGYRKALRLMKQAEKFHRPILLFVDTPGAFCGIGAEERGQGEAIARNLYEMATIRTPILSIITGEGGSGGALALAVADEVWAMQHAVYSVLSPEGYASILWKDGTRAKEAAAQMKMTARDLKRLEIIERIIPEFPVVGKENINHITFYMKRKIAEFLIEYMEKDDVQLIENRYNRFRKF